MCVHVVLRWTDITSRVYSCSLELHRGASWWCFFYSTLNYGEHRCKKKKEKKKREESRATLGITFCTYLLNQRVQSYQLRATVAVDFHSSQGGATLNPTYQKPKAKLIKRVEVAPDWMDFKPSATSALCG